MASCQSRSAGWATTGALSWPGLCWASSNRPPTSWLAASFHRSRCSSPLFWFCWPVPRVSPMWRLGVASDGRVHDRASPRTYLAPALSGPQHPAALGDPHGHHADAATVRWRLLGRDRDPRLHLLGVGGGTESL